MSLRRRGTTACAPPARFNVPCLCLPTPSFLFSVWARSTTLTQCAYRRVQRKASHRVRSARLYGESVLTKSPLAVNVVNYVRTRDPEIRDNLVQQAKAATTVRVLGPQQGVVRKVVLT